MVSIFGTKVDLSGEGVIFGDPRSKVKVIYPRKCAGESGILWQLRPLGRVYFALIAWINPGSYLNLWRVLFFNFTFKSNLKT